MLELGDEHRWHTKDARASFVLNGVHRCFGIERFRGDHHRAAVSDRRQVAHHTAKAVVERHRHAQPIVWRQAKRLANEISVVQDVVMRERRAFRRAGCSRRVLNVHGGIELDGGFACTKLRQWYGISASEQLWPRDATRIALLAEVDDRAQRW